MQHFSLLLVAFLSLVFPIFGSMSFSDNAGHRLTLPISTTSNSSGGWTYSPSSGSLNTYSLIIYNMASTPNVESFVLVPDYSTGCSLGTSSYSGSYTPVNSRPFYGNSTNPSTNPGIYFFTFNIPAGTWLIVNITYTNHISTETMIVDWINLAIQNPPITPPVSSSSSGSAAAPIVWPGGRGPIGLTLNDNCCGSSDVPYRSGWSWSESSRDISQYSLSVSFLYHLLQNSSFYIERTFGDATVINSTRQNGSDALVVGDYFGSIDNPILDDTANYVYNFHIPHGKQISIDLHYTYINPDQPSVVHRDVVQIRISNDFIPPCFIHGYDLSAIATADIYVPSGWFSNTIRVCGGPLANPAPCDSNAMVCQSSGMAVAHYDASAIQWTNTSNGLQAVIANGDATYCETSAGRVAIINYVCDVSATQPVATASWEGPSCTYNFNIATSAVCPS